ncbi:hypothetical protein Tco_0761532 [Tanacetum coccineum]
MSIQFLVEVTQQNYRTKLVLPNVFTEILYTGSPWVYLIHNRGIKHKVWLEKVSGGYHNDGTECNGYDLDRVGFRQRRFLLTVDNLEESLTIPGWFVDDHEMQGFHNAYLVYDEESFYVDLDWVVIQVIMNHGNGSEPWALLAKWVWRFLSHDNSLWYRVISGIHGSNAQLSAAHSSLWKSIINSTNSLKEQGVDILSHFKIRIGNGLRTSFWKDLWVGDSQLQFQFPRLFALESFKDISVAEKLNGSLLSSFRQEVRGGTETHQYELLSGLGLRFEMVPRMPLNGLAPFVVSPIDNEFHNDEKDCFYSPMVAYVTDLSKS